MEPAKLTLVCTDKKTHEEIVLGHLAQVTKSGIVWTVDDRNVVRGQMRPPLMWVHSPSAGEGLAISSTSGAVLLHPPDDDGFISEEEYRLEIVCRRMGISTFEYLGWKKPPPNASCRVNVTINHENLTRLFHGWMEKEIFRFDVSYW